MKTNVLFIILLVSQFSYAGGEGNAGGPRFREFSSTYLEVMNTLLYDARARQDEREVEIFTNYKSLIQNVSVDFSCEDAASTSGRDCENFPDEGKIICNENRWVQNYPNNYRGRINRAMLVVHEVLSASRLETSGSMALSIDLVQMADVIMSRSGGGTPHTQRFLSASIDREIDTCSPESTVIDFGGQWNCYEGDYYRPYVISRMGDGSFTLEGDLVIGVKSPNARHRMTSDQAPNFMDHHNSIGSIIRIPALHRTREGIVIQNIEMEVNSYRGSGVANRLRTHTAGTGPRFDVRLMSISDDEFQLELPVLYLRRLRTISEMDLKINLTCRRVD